MEDQDGHEPPTPQNSNQDEGGREEEEEEEEGETGEGRVSEYERERLSRIKENRARLEALGLLRPPSKHPRGADREKKATRKRGDGDDDYRPSDEDRNDEDEDYETPPTGSRRNLKPKGRKKVSFSVAKTKKSPIPEENTKEDEVVDDDDDEASSLQQAIALSLGSVTECSTVAAGWISQNSGKNIGDAQTNESKATLITQDTSVKKKKRRKLNTSRVQLTEDEVVAFFFSFDEAGKGHITLRDLRRMAIAHDFSWSEMETALMIHCFDSDKDAKFRRVSKNCVPMQLDARAWKLLKWGCCHHTTSKKTSHLTFCTTIRYVELGWTEIVDVSPVFHFLISKRYV